MNIHIQSLFNREASHRPMAGPGWGSFQKDSSFFISTKTRVKLEFHFIPIMSDLTIAKKGKKKLETRYKKKNPVPQTTISIKGKQKAHTDNRLITLMNIPIKMMGDFISTISVRQNRETESERYEIDRAHLLPTTQPLRTRTASVVSRKSVSL